MIKETTKRNTTGMEVAVIGMAGRFPGAANIDEFWENLKNGVESISFLSEKELMENGLEPEIIQDPNYVKAHGILEEAGYFDSNFFGYTNKEAEIMNPQMRLFHECVWHALEDAGYEPGSYVGLIGLYAGASSSFDWEAISILTGESSTLGAMAAGILTNKELLCTRVSYKLSLKGPSLFVHTACSTSLVAIHMACRALLTGECKVALAGGISISTSHKGYRYQESMINSPDGHCRAFDQKSQGIVSGNGVGVVVLKTLKNAVADRDYIYAVVLGTAINNDGIRKVGYTAPSVDGQVEVIRIAHRLARVQLESISYIETHGTGTSLGDSVEVEALKKAFNTDRKKFCAIGSIKTNMGHLDTAAGVAGFMKTVLALKNRLIPPSLHFETPNPKIHIDNTPFYVNSTLKEWKGAGYPLRAGVSSFGIGGTNAHVIVEQAPVIDHSSFVIGEKRKEKEYRLILLSAKNQSAPEKMTGNLEKYLKKNPGINLADVSYTLQVGRKAFQYRKMMTCASIKETIKALSSPRSSGVHSSYIKEKNKTVIFMFSGQGSQYVNMGRELYLEEPLFRDEVDRCMEILENKMGHNVKHILYPGETPHHVSGEEEAREKINDVIYSGPIKFTFEYALAKLLMKWGINPDAMIGHSFGEYVVAHLAGVFSLEDSLSLVVLRGQLMSRMPKGVMMSVPLSQQKLRPLLGEVLSLAAVNTPSHCIVSGPTAVVNRLEKQLYEEGHECLRLNFPRASHSKMMTPILKEFESFAGQLKLNKPQIPYISCLTGKWISVDEATNPGYWAKHLVETVRFSDGVKKLLEKENPIFIQMGSDRGLPQFVKQNWEGEKEIPVINLVKHKKEKKSDIYYLLHSIGLLWLYGVDIDWDEFYSREERYRVPLPTYPFERQFYWFEVDLYGMSKKHLAQSVPLSRKRPDIHDWFYIPSWKSSLLPVLRADSMSDNYTWMIFIDEGGLGVQLIKKLQQHNQELIIVKIGTKFSRLSNSECVINPAVRDDYDSLFTTLAKVKKVPLKILYLWCIPGKNENLTFERLETGTILSFNSLIYLLQAIGIQDFDDTHKFQLFIITIRMHKIGGEGLLYPESALTLGPVKVSPLEYHNIITMSIDIDSKKPGNWQEERLIEQLLAEFMTESKDLVIAYRGNERLVQTFEPVYLDKIKGMSPLLKEEGTYLITGGLSGIGLELAGYLSKKVRARLILIGRSEFPPRDHWDQWLASHDKNDATSCKILKLKEFESWGAETLTLIGNVANMERMEQIVARGQAHFGRINGVIHSAGVPEGSIIQRKTEEIMSHVLEAKVKGTLVLHEVLKDVDMDFFILCSSGNSICPNSGQVGYCAANCFLDAFAHYRREVHNKFTLSVNWDRWLNTGMSIAVEARYKEITGEEIKSGMTAQQGIDAFERIIGYAHSQVVVSTTNLSRLIEIFNENIRSKERKGVTAALLAKKSYPRPDLSTAYVAPGNNIEHTLASLWQTFFGIETVGIDDDFFELGGDSLKAMTLIAQIHKKLDVRVPVADFFSRGTNIKNLAEYISGNTKKSIHSSINPAEKMEFYPLSPAQRRIYILYQMDKDRLAYNVSTMVTLEGTIEKEKLEEVFRKLIRRHESLRTSFTLMEDQLIQKLHQEVDFEIEQYQVHEEYLNISTNSLERPFELSNAPLLRVGLINISGEKHILMTSMHHIVSDGVSIGILIKEFHDFYNGVELPALKLQYKDYSEWQRTCKEEKEILKIKEDYWLQQFEENISVLNLPFDYPRPELQSYEGSKVNDKIGITNTKALKEIALEEGATLFMVLLALYNIFLSKLSSQEYIVVGVPTAGRRHADLQEIIGMFVNTLAFYNHPSGEKEFTVFLREIKKRTLEAFENQEYQFEELVEKVAVERDMSRNPLFDVMFTLQGDAASSIKTPGEARNGLEFKPYAREKSSAKVDLNLETTEIQGKLYFTFEYCTKLFKEETIIRFVQYFKNLVSAFTANTGMKISEIEIITNKEKKQVLLDFNATETSFAREKAVYQLFEEQARRTPGKIAIVGSGQSVVGKAERIGKKAQLTYKELNKASNQLANRLYGKGIKPDTIVGIMVERSLEMIIGLLGILKAGGAYLPIDPEYPQERINYMLADSKAKFLVTTPGLVEKYGLLSIVNCQLLIVNEKFPACPRLNTPPKEANSINNYQLTINNSQLNSSNLAYIIYTSGSTGKPKGVMINHKSFVNFIKGITDIIDFQEKDTILSLTTISFDIFGLETILPLTRGSRVVMGTGEEQLNAEAAALAVIEFGVTILQVTPSRLSMLIAIEQWVNCLKCLRYLLVGGEALPAQLLEQARQLTKEGKIYNMYGPTETTIWSTLKEVSPGKSLNIGKPIANTYVYILDKNLKLQPPQIVGDLWLGGIGLARGYTNRVELTAEKFTANPYKKEEHLYATGDMAKWLHSGNIEFLGRKDDQVKIRGFRIELKEIEARLVNHADIKETVVVCRSNKNGDKYLCAYIVTAVEKNLDITGLKEFLNHTLPAYMIPSYFVQIDRVPLTSNFKIDRKALPAPVLKPVEYVPPGDEIEEKLVEAWSNVLDIKKEKISILANFFELGGHSLKATMLSLKVHKKLQVKLPLTEVFKAPTIKNLSQFIKRNRENRQITIELAEMKEYYALSSAQKRLFILNQIQEKEKSTSYNMLRIYMVEGELERERLERSFASIVERHETLRTSFHLINDEPVQKIEKKLQFKINYHECTEEQAKERMKTFIKPFDLTRAPLFRVELLKVNEIRYFILFDIHHIISDGISMEILVKELLLFYQRKNPESLAIQYKDYTEWQNNLLKKEQFKRCERYWFKKMDNFVFTRVPGDNSIPGKSFEEASENVFIDPLMYKKIADFCNRHGITKFTFMISVFMIVLSREIDQKDITIATPFTTRDHYQLKNLIGIFFNLLLIRSTIDKNDTFLNNLLKIKQVVFEAFENHLYPYELLNVNTRKTTYFKSGELFSILFNYVTGSENTSTLSQPLKIRPYNPGTAVAAKCDMELYVLDFDGDMGLSIVYKSHFYSRYKVTRILENLAHVINTLLKDEHIIISGIKPVDRTMEMLEKENQNFELKYNDLYENDDLFFEEKEGQQ